MILASIDIGTNTLRLLIAELKPGEGRSAPRIKPLLYKRAITRLGGGYTANGGIDKARAERTIEALEGFRDAIKEYGVKEVFAVATSVVRRAVNREDFLKDVLLRTGIEVNVISGDEEARITLAGVLSVVNGKKRDRVVIDIGGGSTEFILTDGADIAGAWSMEMGVVHLSERYLKSDPPRKSELEDMDREIKGVVEDLRRRINNHGLTIDKYSGKNGAEIIGTAGTITTLAAIDQGLTVYDRDRINNWILGRKRVEDIYGNLITLTLGERAEVLSLEKGREDLIIPGTAIALSCMESFGFDSMRASDAGLLEGVIQGRLREGHGNTDLRLKEDLI
ncbi:MAG: exopolyphosphatase [Deltaproteobacteria bacterium]|nr:exopolyphosphatase [Deltaproteobacteria bacterium]